MGIFDPTYARSIRIHATVRMPADCVCCSSATASAGHKVTDAQAGQTVEVKACPTCSWHWKASTWSWLVSGPLIVPLGVIGLVNVEKLIPGMRPTQTSSILAVFVAMTMVVLVLRSILVLALCRKGPDCSTRLTPAVLRAGIMSFTHAKYADRVAAANGLRVAEGPGQFANISRSSGLLLVIGGLLLFGLGVGLTKTSMTDTGDITVWFGLIGTGAGLVMFGLLGLTRI
jgi:hypothetical protein